MATTHGQAGNRTRSRTYLIWQSMVGRCYRPSDGSYKWYGAKGVTVCDRWRKFEEFFADMGTAPDGMHIHRTNGSTVYSKETCQWINESEHIGLHNQEKGWGARMNRTQLIDALAGAKATLAAERERTKTLVDAIHAHKELACCDSYDILDAALLVAALSDAEREALRWEKQEHAKAWEKVQTLRDALKFYSDQENYVDDVLGMPDGTASEVAGSSEINQDGGMKARDALAKVK